MKLVIISHTEHYKKANGTIVGWGPTVTEINHLLEVFDSIYHIAMLHDAEAPASALPYVSNRVVFVPLPALGGQTISSKLQLLWKAPQVIRIINKTLKKAEWFQFRAPTGIGVYIIPFLILCTRKPGWFKYAGNWKQEKPPLGYAIQRYFLKKQSRKVTINGSWINQHKQCITFENPCLTNEELLIGKTLAKQKTIEGKLTCCYVGRLEKPKGVERILLALKNLSSEEKKRIEVLHLVGNGVEMPYFKQISKEIGITVKFHGFLSRTKVFEIYKKSQVFLMPTTASEGFPKVIAEAMNFGCIPVVSKISSIGQYVKHLETGICLENVTIEDLEIAIKTLSNLRNIQYHNIIENQRPIVKKFGFENYNQRIKSEIIS